MGTNCSLRWREAGERERVWNIDPAHPITQGIGDYFELPHVEMYGERFDIPSDGHVVFISWYEGGEVFRSGVTLQRGNGRIFYFRPGHETYPSFYDKNVLKILSNAIRWASPSIRMPYPVTHCPDAYEKISSKEISFGKAGITRS